MAWSRTLINLQYVLADLYFDKEDSVKIVRAAGLQPAQIRWSNNPTTNWSNILDEAVKQDLVDAIITASLREYPKNEYLLSAKNGTLTPVRNLVDDSIVWYGEQPIETLEKIMGKQSTILPISWLESALDRSRSVAKVERADQTYGTGFLISGNILLTNHHVLKSVDEARAATILFNYQQTESRLDRKAVSFKLDPDATFVTSLEDDWTAVAVQGDASRDWGAIQLKDVRIEKEDRANIIQHPGGGSKQIAFHHNIVAYADEKRIQYLTDTLPGSSGSPVFDDNWQLVAIHHSGGSILDPGMKKHVYRNEGISVTCLIAGLRQAGLR